MREQGAVLLSYLAAITPSAWAALAAFTSAFAAWLTWRITRHNLLYSVRPELVLDEWTLATQDDKGTITIGTITNYGRGPALRVTAYLSAPDRRPNSRIGLTLVYLGVIPPGHTRPLAATGTFSWSQDGVGVRPSDDRTVWMHLSVYCFDIHNNRHELRLTLIAENYSAGVVGAEILTYGLSQLNREVFVRPLWRIRWLNRSRRFRRVTVQTLRRTRTLYL